MSLPQAALQADGRGRKRLTGALGDAQMPEARGGAPDAQMSEALRYRRVLLKISGEALMGNRDYGLDPAVLERIAQEIKVVHDLGVQLCLVTGGGNIFRGIRSATQGLERATGDYVGMLATVMNALTLQAALERLGAATRVLSAIAIAPVCEPYIRRRAIRHLEKGRIVIFAAGTGNPFFTTDTAAALRASEMNCDALLKGTKVAGVYTSDPLLHKDAAKLDRLTFHEVLARDLKVMDASAVSLARENSIPIIVFSIQERGSIAEVLHGRGSFTLIAD
jgi:uridylate kinase